MPPGQLATTEMKGKGQENVAGVRQRKGQVGVGVGVEAVVVRKGVADDGAGRMGGGVAGGWGWGWGGWGHLGPFPDGGICCARMRVSVGFA